MIDRSKPSRYNFQIMIDLDVTVVLLSTQLRPDPQSTYFSRPSPAFPEPFTTSLSHPLYKDILSLIK